MVNDTKSTTSTTANLSMGTNLVIRNVPVGVEAAIDANLDDGNSSTGRVRYDPAVSPTAMYYSLGLSRTL